MPRRKFEAILILVLIVLLVGCGTQTTSSQQSGQASQAANFSMTLGTSAAGGAFPLLGNAIMEDIKRANPDITGSTIPSGGSTANLLGIHEGKYNLGLSVSDVTADAWNGEGYFKDIGKLQDLREIAAFYPNVSHIVVWANSNIRTIEDLRGKRVSPAMKAAGGDVEFQRLLKLYNMSYKDMNVQFLSFDDAAQQFIDGHLDALPFMNVYYPFPSILNVASKGQIRLIHIPDDKVQGLSKFQGVRPITLPPNVYPGVNYEVKGTAVDVHIVARKDLPDDIAYKVTKTITENLERYGTVISPMKRVKPQDLALDVGIPFHPGALKYYQEKGMVK